MFRDELLKEHGQEMISQRRDVGRLDESVWPRGKPRGAGDTAVVLLEPE